MPDNKAIHDLQVQMELDNFRRNLPYLFEQAGLNAAVLKSRYDALLKEGFDEKQALRITIEKPLTEL